MDADDKRKKKIKRQETVRGGIHSSLAPGIRHYMCCEPLIVLEEGDRKGENHVALV